MLPGQKLFIDSSISEPQSFKETTIVQVGASTSFSGYATASTIVDWGDGNVQTYSVGDNTYSHSYSDTSEHTITVTDTLSSFYGKQSYAKTVHLADGIKLIKSYGFNEGPTTLEEVIGYGVQSIGDSGSSYVFAGNNWVKRVIFPNATYACYGAFHDLALIEKLDIRSIENIDLYWTINKCPYITSLYLPNVKSIKESNNFYGCTRLATIDFGTDKTRSTIPTIGSANQFDGCAAGYKILVPASLYNDWINTYYWSSIASHIEAH